MAGVPVQNDSGTKLDVKLSQVESEIGYAAIVGENDDGTAMAAPYFRSPEVTDDYRLRVGLDTLLDFETFNYAAQNTGKHAYANTAMTITWNGAGNFMRTNGASITTTTTGVRFITQRTFSMLGASTLYCEFKAGLSASLAATTNTTIDIGLFTPGAANPYAPTDGAFVRMNSTGVYGIATYNSTDNPSSNFTTDGSTVFMPTIGQIYKFSILISPGEVHFYVDDTLRATVTTGAGNYAPLVSGSAPFAVRHAIVGGAAGAVNQLLVGSYFVSAGDLHNLMDAPTQRAFAGQAYQGMSGGTMGSLANYANSANPTSAAGSNTAALVTGLGGQAACNATASAATDFIFWSYQNPAGSLAQVPRVLVINGVWLSAMNAGAAVATTPTTVWWAVAFGHTAVSLATGEAAATKAPRRIPLGISSVPIAGAIGVPYTPADIYRQFATPIVVNPGEFVALIGKIIVGTATASQSVWVSSGVDHYFV